MPKDYPKIDALLGLNSAEIRALCVDLFGRALPIPPHRDLLFRCLAYRIQEQRLGGLSSSVQKRLNKLVSLVEAGASGVLDIPKIKSGTRLIREWQGNVHEVTVAGDAYIYRDKQYRSLSEIARLITGTRWSGPLFFGLRNRNGGHG